MFNESLSELKKSSKSGFKNRQKVVDQNCLGSEFQTDGAENRKARLAISVLVNSWVLIITKNMANVLWLCQINDF